MVALALGGAMLGFAPFNRPVARLFLGDVGSLPIGLLLGWLLLLAGDSRPSRRGAAAAAVLCRRRHHHPAAPTHPAGAVLAGPPQPLLPAGAGSRFQRSQVVGRVFAVNVILAVLAVATVLGPGPAAASLALACGAALVAGLLIILVRGRR